MKRFLVDILLVAGLVCWNVLPASERHAGALAANQATVLPLSPTAPRKAGGVDGEARRRQQAEREAELAAKDDELKRMSTRIDGQIKELESARKAMEDSLDAGKKADAERYRKMVKVYKALRPEEAAKLMDKLDEEIAIEMLNRMDTKTAVKIIPFLNQPRVLQWTRGNLKGSAAR